MKKNKKILVVKYGGSLMDDNASNAIILGRIKKLAENYGVIVVHGGGKAISKAMENAGIKPKFIDGLRFTDSKSIKIAKNVLDDIQKSIVKKLKNGAAIPCVSYGKRIKKLGYVGKFTKADTGPILTGINSGKICVLNSIGRGTKGVWLNMNADDVASGIACLLKADKLVFFTNVAGVLDKKGKTIKVIRRSGANKLIEKGVVSGGMIPKINGCLDAIAKGVKEIGIVSVNMKGTKIL